MDPRPEMALDAVSADGHTTPDCAIATPGDGRPVLPRLGWYARWLKRVIDVVGATVVLAVLAPVVFVAMVAVRRSIGPPVLATQYRVGRAGRPFAMRRLRTKQATRTLDVRDPGDHADMDLGTAAGWSVEFRRTATTRRLRRWRLDVLPQLVNVIKGEMSLVGPRPMTWQEAVSERLLDHPRHMVRPGLTGPAQLIGRGYESLDEQLRFDLDYIECVGLRVDLMILARSLLVVLRRPPTKAHKPQLEPQRESERV